MLPDSALRGIDELYYHMFKKTMGTRATISLGDENLDPERSNYYSINMEYRTNRFSASVTGYLELCKEHGNFQIH
ncbi:TonB-dependent receptor [Bacteroides uniformis]|nr:TonB-dependent receptor [Bacteroides uniformis]